eukprot:sb/3474679/
MKRKTVECGSFQFLRHLHWVQALETFHFSTTHLVFSFTLEYLRVMKFLIVCLAVFALALAVPDAAKEKDGEYIMDIPEGLDFIEEEFIEPIPEEEVGDEDIGSAEETIELLSRSEMAALEKDLSDMDLVMEKKK